MEDFFPVILGSTIIAYYMARCFHQEYAIKPLVVGREQLGPVQHSEILDFRAEPTLWDRDAFADVLVGIGKEYADRYGKLLLIGTSDQYVRQIIECRDVLQEYFTFNYMSMEQLDQITVKANFYDLCRESGMDIPETVAYNVGGNEPVPTFGTFPRVIKPSDVDSYFRSTWTGQKKVYRAYSNEEVRDIVALVRRNGYTGELIIQDFIPGDDTFIYDAVFYADKSGKCRFMSFAQVILQEHAASAVGSYTALLTRFDQDYMDRLKEFVENFHYTGFGNADIKFDARDGTFKLFEINARQGRSSYYVTPCGFNLAKYLVDDLVYDTDKEFEYVRQPLLHKVVPFGIIRKYVSDPALKREARALMRSGDWVDPFRYPKDLSARRRIYLLLHAVNYYKKYRQETW